MTAVASDKTTMPPRVLRAADLDEQQLADVLRQAAQMKRDPYRWAGALPGRTLVTLVEQPSTRARASFAAAAQRLTRCCAAASRSISARSDATPPPRPRRSLLLRQSTSSS
jgi:ornithine carbamoyltransferase